MGARESLQDVLVIPLETAFVYHHPRYLGLDLQSFPLATFYLCLSIAECIYEICSHIFFFSSCNPWAVANSIDLI